MDMAHPKLSTTSMVPLPYVACPTTILGPLGDPHVQKGQDLQIRILATFNGPGDPSAPGGS